MKWVRGKFGNINNTGEPHSGAAILKSSHRQFWSAIEPGVRPLVRAIVAKGYDTFSSCEGHIYPDGQEVLRAIDLIIEKKNVKLWIACIEHINTKNKIDIKYMLLDEEGLDMAMTRPYHMPVRIAFLIGRPSDSNIQYKTSLLLKFFKSLPNQANPSEGQRLK